MTVLLHKSYFDQIDIREAETTQQQQLTASKDLSSSHNEKTAVWISTTVRVTLLRPNPNQIYMVKTTGDLPMMYPRLISVIKYQGFELCRNGQDILRCFVCGGAQGGWQSTLPHTKSKGGSDCSDAASKPMLSCSLVWLRYKCLGSRNSWSEGPNTKEHKSKAQTKPKSHLYCVP